jgi:hypothetical protein
MTELISWGSSNLCVNGDDGLKLAVYAGFGEMSYKLALWKTCGKMQKCIGFDDHSRGSDFGMIFHAEQLTVTLLTHTD